MTIDEFIVMTQNVIARSGFQEYLPTLVLETRRAIEVAVLEDVPPDVGIESFARDWASSVTKPNQNYLLGFKVDESHFKVVSRHKGVLDERIAGVEHA